MSLKSIVKVVLLDGEEIVLKVKPIEATNSTDEKLKRIEQYNSNKAYLQQFRDFEKKLLASYISDNAIEDYAKRSLDLKDIDEATCYRTHLETCRNEQLIIECEQRGIKHLDKFKTNIVNSSFIERFCKIVHSGNSILIEEWLSEMEENLKIIAL